MRKGWCLYASRSVSHMVQRPKLPPAAVQLRHVWHPCLRLFMLPHFVPLQVQEASAASSGFWRMPDAWVNLANVYLAQVRQFCLAVAAVVAAACGGCRCACWHCSCCPCCHCHWSARDSAASQQACTYSRRSARICTAAPHAYIPGRPACPADHVPQEQYIPAIQMYRNALRKFYDNRSAMVMLYLARCVRWLGTGGQRPGATLCYV